MEIEPTEAWDTVRKHLGSLFGFKKVPKELVLQAFAEFLDASQVENLIADERMVVALQGWKSSDAAPPSVGDAPGLDEDEAPLLVPPRLAAVPNLE